MTTTALHFPRFAKDGTDRALRVTYDEKCAGMRAPYHVYYLNKKGKRMVDAAFRQTPQGAVAFIEKAVKGAKILGVVSTVPIEGMEYPRDIPA